MKLGACSLALLTTLLPWQTRSEIGREQTERPTAFVTPLPTGVRLDPGGYDDLTYRYAWQNGGATLVRTIPLAKKPSGKSAQPGKSGSNYPAGLAVSESGKYL
jgi:hypothetical protein